MKPEIHSTTILSVRRGSSVVVAGDGQVTLGNTVVKGGARKVRRLGEGRAIGGFAGSAADGFALFERFDDKLREQRSPLRRAAVELAKDWRTDRALRRLEAMLVVADAESTFILSGTGDVIEPDDGVVRDRLGRQLRARRGARARSRHTELDAARDRRERDADRRRDLHLHEHQPHDRGAARDARTRSTDAELDAARDRRASSTATSSASARPSARSRSRCATAGAASRSTAICATRSRRRTSS